MPTRARTPGSAYRLPTPGRVRRPSWTSQRSDESCPRWSVGRSGTCLHPTECKVRHCPHGPKSRPHWLPSRPNRRPRICSTRVNRSAGYRLAPRGNGRSSPVRRSTSMVGQGSLCSVAVIISVMNFTTLRFLAPFKKETPPPGSAVLDTLVTWACSMPAHGDSVAPEYNPNVTSGANVD